MDKLTCKKFGWVQGFIAALLFMSSISPTVAATSSDVNYQSLKGTQLAAVVVSRGSVYHGRVYRPAYRHSYRHCWYRYGVRHCN